MNELTFRVSLTSAGEPDEEGLASLRISLKKYIRDALNLTKGEVLKITVIGIYENKKATEKKDVNFPLYGTVSIVGGKKSLGMTIEKDEVRRRNLNEDNDLEIKIEILSRALSL